MVAQDYITEAHNVHVIIGNVALVKCEIPSFVADFVSVVSWTDGHGNQFFLNDRTTLGRYVHKNQGVTQAFCHQSIKPFFFLVQVSVVFAVVSQDYVARVHEIDVILGNAALLKCEIPSFVIDFVSVINWVDNEGAEHFITENTGIFLKTTLKECGFEHTSKLLHCFCSGISRLRDASQ